MSFLTIGTWIILAVAFVCFLIATEKGSGIGSTVTMILTILALYMFGSKTHITNIFNFCQAHGLIIFVMFVLYIVVGVFWSIIKWFFFLLKIKDKETELLEKDLREKSHYCRHVSAPLAQDNKEAILVWMFYWPFSAIWTLIDQPVKRIYKFIYRKIANYLQNISNKMFDPLVTSACLRQKEIDDEAEKRKNHTI